MATLYQTTFRARRAILLILVIVALILGLDSLSKYLQSPYNPFTQLPSFYLAVTSDGIQVPTPPIQSLAIAPDSTPTFAIDGAFAAHPDTVMAYTIERPREKLDSVETAVQTAANLGFPEPYAQIGTEELLWENSSGTRQLTYNKQSQTWKLRTQYFQDVEALKPKDLQTDISQLQNLKGTLLSNLGFSETSLTRGQALATLAKLGADGLFTHPVNSSSADYASLTIFRELQLAQLKSSSEMPTVLKNLPAPAEFEGLVYTSDPRIGSLRLVGSNAMRDLTKDIFELDFVNYEYNYNFLVRQAVSPSEAWDNVQKGSAALRQLKLQTADYFASSQSLSVKRFVVDARLTELGFWEPDDWDGFVYPIYIFKGRAELADGKVADFIFYADAIKRFN